MWICESHFMNCSSVLSSRSEFVSVMEQFHESLAIYGNFLALPPGNGSEEELIKTRAKTFATATSTELLVVATFVCERTNFVPRCACPNTFSEVVSIVLFCIFFFFTVYSVLRRPMLFCMVKGSLYCFLCYRTVFLFL